METNDFILKRVPPNYRAPFVLAAGLVCMLSFGVVYTFGNLLPYLVSFMRWKVDPTMTTGTMVWLQTVIGGVPFSMLFGGLLERKFGGRITVLVGSILYTSSCAISFYTIQHSFYLFLFTFGFTLAFGSGIAYNGVLITAQRWLPDNVGLAGGLIVGGFGCGAFVLSPLQTMFINPLNYSVNKDGYFTEEDLLERVPGVFIVMSFLFVVLQFVGIIFLGDPTEQIEEEDEPLINSPLPEKSLREMLCSTTFLFLFITLSLNSLWVNIGTGLYKAFGQKYVHSDMFLSMVGSIGSIFNCISRVSWGVVADKTSYQTCMSIACAAGAAIMWLLPIIEIVPSKWLLMLLVALMFTCVGGTYSLLPFATHRCFGTAHFGVIYGLIQMSISVAGILVGLMSQFLLPLIGYNYIFLIGGSFMTISMIITSLIHYTPYALMKDLDDYEASRRGSVMSNHSRNSGYSHQ